MAKPWRIPYFDPTDTVAACLQRILRTRSHEMFSYETAAIEGSNVEAVHSMRVSNRRLKALMKIFSGCFPKSKFEFHYGCLRSLLRSLGQVRDCDVFINTLEEQKQFLGARDHRAVDLLIARQKQLRYERRKSLTQELRLLRDRNYEEKFLQFLTKSLQAD